MPEPYGKPWHGVDDLNADQLRALQTMDTARLEGVLTDADVRMITAMIHQGKTAGARKRVTEARRAAREETGS
ncbi:MAG: hypothetical protein GEU68_16980 [Actinobacteria bacterium]|nr:hypothetical protein [Actinomycetota bacterium]